MAEDADYYAVLGTSRGASEDEIKKAYRKAALRWHPDKNPENRAHAEAMFKTVAEAYEVLSNPEKRSSYDRYGKDGPRGAGAGAGFGAGRHDMSSAFNIFEQFFGGKDPFAEFDEIFAEMHGGARRSGVPGARAGRGSGMGMGMGTGSMFNDDFFSSGFGGGGGSSMFTSFSSSSGAAGGGMMTSTSTTTKIVNGKKVTITEKTVRKPDGTVETTRSESTSDADGGGRRSGGMMGDDFFGGGFFGGGGRPGRQLGF